MSKYVDTYIADLEAIQRELVMRLRTLIPKLQSLSQTELIEVSRALDFLKEMDMLGYGKALENLYSSFNGEVVKVIDLANAMNIPKISSVNLAQIDFMRDLELSFIKSEAGAYAASLKREMLRGIISGTPAKDLAARLIQDFGPEAALTGPQKRVLVNDAFSRLSNASTKQVFADVPKQKFVYIGPSDSVTRDECQQALSLPPQTADEINGLGYVDFDSRGGWNCRHDWVPVAPEGGARA